MTKDQIFQAIYESWLGQTTRDSTWLFSSYESIHFLGLCILMGALLVVDLRLMGFFRRMPIASALNYTHFAVLGFALNLLSGIGFVVSDPFNYLTNPAFGLKMALVFLAGLNVAWFEFVERRRVLALAPDSDTHPGTKLVAGLSLGLWTLIIILGRLLPQFGLAG